MKKALISGISGQDGAYLAKLLLDRGYEVCGTSRDAQMSGFGNLARLGIRDRVKLESMSLNDFRSVLQVLAKNQPDEVYNLAGQSSVGLSFEQPVETLESIATGTLNLLEAIRFTGRKIKLYNASSSECFGDTGGSAADENTPFRPRSPYAVAKATAFWEVANYREAYNLFACSGILFNHESPLRPGEVCYPKNCICGVPNCCRQFRKTAFGKYFSAAGLGLGAGICGGDVFDVAAGRTGRLCNCHRCKLSFGGVCADSVCFCGFGLEGTFRNRCESLQTDGDCSREGKSW